MFVEETRSSSGVPKTAPEAPAVPTRDETTESVAAADPGVSGVSVVPETLEETPPALASEAVEVEAAVDAESAESIESADISSLFADMEKLSPLTPGEVVRCTVLKVTDTEVIVDIGLKSEAALSRSEFLTEDGTVAVNRNDVVELLIESYDEEEGTVTASYQKALRRRAWDSIERAFREQASLPGRVRERTKGGLEVDLDGVRAFLPASQADIRPLRNLESLIGKEIICKVAKLDRKRSNVVVSRKAALEEELNRRKKELLDQLAEGGILTGRVKNLVDYGAFVDLGGMDGLLHITDLSWGRIAHPSEVIQVGQEIRVKVLKYTPEKERVSLGLKQLQPDPWEQVAGEYKVGDRAVGRVVSLTDYGAFVELLPGIEGLIHISEMTWSKRLKHPSKIVKVGERVDVAVLDVNPAQRRISLSLRQTLPDPWTTLSERLAVGGVVEGRVRNLTDFGAFVEIEEGVEGLIHLSDLSWTKRVKHPSEILKKGQKIEAVILGLDVEHRRLSLGLKQLQPDVWETFFEKTRVGDILLGKVARMAPFGAFVELEEGIEGLCHISEMGPNHGEAGKRELEVGREFRFRVIRLSPGEKRIGLSLNNVEPEEPAGAGNGTVKAEPAVTATPVEEQAAPAPDAPAEAAEGDNQLRVASNS
ncbi:MAG TPA: 30S ribosomal protein S1 [Terriglobia bacterium]|nr:30S ribosomal protein S1 [Terriglobia bacterium]